MTISVLSAARRLGQTSGWTLTNLEMQKILYLAHMFQLGRTGQPLVFGNFEAWDYGPVHPELYHRAKIFGSDPVEDIFPETRNPLEGGADRAIIDEAFNSLGNLGPGRLVNLTHRRGGAWETNYIPGARHIIIPNDEILNEYRDLENEHGRQAAG